MQKLQCKWITAWTNAISFMIFGQPVSVVSQHPLHVEIIWIEIWRVQTISNNLVQSKAAEYCFHYCFLQLKCGGIWQFLHKDRANVCFYISSDLKLHFEEKLDLVLDFCDTNIWINQITKHCKQLKKLPNNASIDPMFSH